MTDTAPKQLSNLPDLGERLAIDYAKLTERRDDVVERLKAVPAVIEDDDQLKAARDAVVDTTAIVGEAKKAHEQEKAPYLKGGKDCDAFFNTNIRDVVTPLKSQVSDKVAVYLDRQRQEREAAARRQEEEARAASQKLADEAAQLESEGRVHEADAKLNAAEAAESQAAQAGAFSSRSATDQSRTSFVGGGTTSVSMVKDFRNLNRNTLDLDALRPFFKQEHLEQAVNAFIKTGQTTLKGVEIYERPRSNIR